MAYNTLMNFWQKIKAEKGMILALSPMDGVSDYPFRSISKKYGQMDLVFTEFANVEGVCLSKSTQILNHFDFDQAQRPLIAQIFGKTPKYFKQVAVLLCEMGVDGIDINMGCPAPTVSSHGSGAGLIRTPDLAREIIQSVQDGVREWGEGLLLENCPDISSQTITALRDKKKFFALTEADRQKLPTVSVKTRIGIAQDEVENWLPNLTQMNLAAISLHGRTLKQSYSGLSNWEVIAKAAAIVKKNSPDTIFLGNGDVFDYEQAKQKVTDYGVDGVLIGRASFGRPFVFLPQDKRTEFLKAHNLFAIALKHAKLYEETYGQKERYSFLPMRKHLAWYTKGVEQAALIRSELVRSNSAAEVEEILKKHQLI
jgi:tRNA-dihydrouridine synthase